MLELAFWTSVLAAGVRLASPILFAALGGLVSERAGILNIGLEGMMLTGAFAGVAGSILLGSPWGGVAFAMVAGASLGLVMAYLTINRSGNQIVVGLALNIFALGLTGFLLNRFPVVGDAGRVTAFRPLVRSGFLRDVPFLGDVVLSQTPIVLIGFFLVGVVWYLLYRTNWGLAARGCGDDPASVDALGLDVVRIRYQATVFGGALAGIGGAVLSLSNLHVFVHNMTAGRGFLALAAYIFGKWIPVGALGAALLFGMGDAFQLRLQTRGIPAPYQLMLGLPYLLGLIALVGVVGRANAPKAAGIPFVPDRHRRKRRRRAPAASSRPRAAT